MMYDALNGNPGAVLRRALCCAALGGSLTALAGAGAGLEPLPGPLRAELRAHRPLIQPEGPLWLRFTLVNTADEAVTIELVQPQDATNGVALPEELVFGTTDEPSLLVTYADEAPVAVKPPSKAEDETPRGRTFLRIGAHGALGVDVDLRAHCPMTRYSGAYRVEWRPLGGRLASVAAEFKIEARKDAIMVTDYGKLTFVLAYETAPQNVANFLELAGQGFYNGKTFHRIVPGGWIQGGCPKGDGTGMRPDGKTVPAEFSDTPVDVGMLLMARKESDPDSASCQFLITLARCEELDGRYTVIGRASDEESLRTLRKLEELPVDRSFRPRDKARINSVNLVTVGQPRVRRLELGSGGKPGAQETAQTPAKSDAGAQQRP